MQTSQWLILVVIPACVDCCCRRRGIMISFPDAQNSTSFETSKKQLTRVTNELIKFGRQNKIDVELVSRLLEGVLGWLEEVMVRLRPDDYKARRNVWSGEEAVSR